MKAPIKYFFKINLLRDPNNSNTDFIVEEKEFNYNEPILGREEAIKKLNSYLEIFPDLNFDINHYDYREVNQKLEKRKNRDNYIEQENIGIGVFFRLNEDYKEHKKGEEFMIYGSGFNNELLDIVYHLEIEYEIYKKYNLKTNNLETKIKFYDYGELEDLIILKTPYKWENIVEESISYYLEDLKQEVEKKDEEKHNETTLENKIKKIIATGENYTTEFKTSLQSHLNRDENKVYFNKKIRFSVIKTIASFLNSYGGVLFIGVNDNKEIVGLDSDYSLDYEEKNNPKDYFLRQIDSIIRKYFFEYMSFLNGRIISIDEKDIYYIVVEKSNKPVFIFNDTYKEIDKYKKEFYVRSPVGASSLQYKDIEQIANYCIEHWNKKS